MISNCTILVICEIIHDSKYLAIFSMMDEIFLYLYLIDFVIKILGIGFNEYFSDVWNKFDFMILFISFISEFFLLEYHTSNFDLSTTPQMSNSIKVLNY